MNIFREITNLIFPKNCFVCGAPRFLLCPACLSTVPRPFDQLEPWILSVFRYKNPTIRQAVWNLKYRGSHAIASDLAPYLYDEILNFLEEMLITEDQTIILIPIPMSKTKFRDRGFNQTEALAKEIEKQNKNLFIYKNNILFKPKETIPQAKIKEKTKRLQNMRGVFKVRNSPNIKNSIIFLVDDITTTGATLTEARKVLRKAGAKKVFAVTVGH